MVSVYNLTVLRLFYFFLLYITCEFVQFDENVLRGKYDFKVIGIVKSTKRKLILVESESYLS